MDRAELVTIVRTIFAEQLFGVLATQGEAGPHTTLVAFAVADDLESLIFATPRGTRKYRNMHSATAVSLFIDDRRNDDDAISQIFGIEARGAARELDGAERERYATVYAARHSTQGMPRRPARPFAWPSASCGAPRPGA